MKNLPLRNARIRVFIQSIAKILVLVRVGVERRMEIVWQKTMSGCYVDDHHVPTHSSSKTLKRAIYHTTSSQPNTWDIFFARYIHFRNANNISFLQQYQKFFIFLPPFVYKVSYSQDRKTAHQQHYSTSTQKCFFFFMFFCLSFSLLFISVVTCADTNANKSPYSPKI